MLAVSDVTEQKRKPSDPDHNRGCRSATSRSWLSGWFKCKNSTLYPTTTSRRSDTMNTPGSIAQPSDTVNTPGSIAQPSDTMNTPGSIARPSDTVNTRSIGFQWKGDQAYKNNPERGNVVRGHVEDVLDQLIEDRPDYLASRNVVAFWCVPIFLGGRVLKR